MHKPGTKLRVSIFDTFWIQCCPSKSLYGSMDLCSEWGSHWRVLVLKVASQWISFLFFLILVLLQ